MKKILGLDLGVGSVGWALIEVDNENNPFLIHGMGSRIVPLGKDEGDNFTKGKTESVCAQRTMFRTARKGLDRYQMRRRQLTETLDSLGMIDPENKMWSLSPIELWQMRADAATEGKRLTPAQLGRVLLHMNQKRGYRHAKADMGDSKQTAYVTEVNDRHRTLKQEGVTVGQYFAKKLKESETLTDTGKKYYSYRIKEKVLPRKAYEEEFDRIMEVQSAFYQEILTPETIADLKNIIFYQRPLKSCKHLVGYCDFMRLLFPDSHKDGRMAEGGPKVAPVSSPIAQTCRLYEAINNIRLVNPFNRKRKNKSDDGVLPEFEIKKTKDFRLMEYEYILNDEERKRVYDALCDNDKLTGTNLLKLLNLKKADGFKFDQSIGKGIKGNTTSCKLREALSGVKNAEELLRFDLKEKDLIKNGQPVVDEETGEIIKILDESYIHEPLYKLWHLIYSISDKEELAKAIERTYGKDFPGITEPEVIDRLFAIDFVKDGYTNKSAKFMRMLLPYLKQGYGYSEAAAIVGVNHSNSMTKEENQARELLPRLDNLQKGELRQPVVEKVLNQMINIVNAVTDRFGRPDEIRVELARSLKQSKNERESTTQAINKNEKENEKIRKIILDHGLNSTRRNVQKYKLHAETGGCCIYCGQPVKLTDFLGGHDAEVEHIIPRSVFFDDSLSNKACACRSCNKEKNNRTAYDYMASKGEEELNRYVTRVEELTSDKKISRTKHNRLLTAGNEIPTDFLNRDLRLTQYISRKAREILSGICHDVHATSGSVTDFFRHAWGYDNVLHTLNFARYKEAGQAEEVEYESNGQIHKDWRIKGWTKRLDHRHHAIDALVVALTRQGYVQRLNNLNQERDAMFSEVSAQSNQIQEKFHLLEKWAETRPHFSVKDVENAVDEIAVSFRAGKKVTTPGKRKIRRGGKTIVMQEGLAIPRGALHKETIYGKIKVLDPQKKIKYALENPQLIADPEIRTIVKECLSRSGYDVSKAMKELKKNPLKKGSKVLDAIDCFKEEIVVRYPVESLEYKHLDSVIDEAAREAIRTRFEEPEINRDAKKFQASLKEKPIMVGGKDKMPVKSVRCFTGNQLSKMVPARNDGKGNIIGYASARNNHHVAFYKDAEGKVQTIVTTFWDCVKRRNYGLSYIITNPREEWAILDTLPETEDKALIALGMPAADWTFLESMQMNEMFVLELSDEQFEDALTEKDWGILTQHLYRVQKLAHGSYNFRRHTITNVDQLAIERDLKNWIVSTSFNNFTSLNPKKVRVTLLGEIIPEK